MKKLLLTLLILGFSLNAAVVEGDNVKPFKLKMLNSDEMVTNGDLKHRVYLLNIWAQWCKGCKKEMAFFDEIAKDNSLHGFGIVAVNIDKKPKKAIKFVKKLEKKLGHKSNIIFLSDSKKTYAKACEAKAIPISFLIKDEKVLKVYLGSFNTMDKEDELIKEIKAALK